MTRVDNGEARTARTPEELDELNRRTLRELDEGLAVVQRMQEDGLRVDIDEAWKEYKLATAPFVLSFDGKDYERPRTTPARVNVFIDAYCLTVDEETQVVRFEVLEDKADEFLGMVLGDELLAAVQASDLEEAFIVQIVRRILRAWGIGVVPADGEAAAEKKSAEPTPVS